MNKLICIVGPTGIGKTKLSLALAHYLETEIINGDAIQIFKDVDILSAKINKEEQEGIPHYLIDELNINETFDVARFKKEATIIIDKINKKGKIPILVGGSGLYVKSLIYDYTFNQVEQRTDEFSLKYESMTNSELFEYLTSIDKESAKILHPNNRKRVLRAIEIYEVNKISKTELHNKQRKELVFNTLIIGLNTNRDILYEMINNRVDKMLTMGLLAEVQKLHTSYPNANYQAMQAIGYKELLPYFSNEITLDEAIASIKQNSRRYAKKQLTWFKNQMCVTWLDSDVNNFDNTIKQAQKLVKDFINNDRTI